MAADDAVSLLRTLKAAGEKTGAVEAEGALHLRRNSRRTMDGIHEPTTSLSGTSTLSLPVPKFPIASSPTSNGTGFGPTLVSNLSFSSGSFLVPSPGSANPAANGPSQGVGLTLTTAGSTSGSLPAIASTLSSPASSPSRISVRPPNPLTSLPSPTGSNSLGGVSAGASGGPPSPPCPGPPHISLSPGLQRRSLHVHAPHGSSFDTVQLPHSHGSPLPLLFDPPVSVPVALVVSSPAGGGAPGVGTPGSPGGRQIQPSPPGASSLPSIAGGGGNSGSGGPGGGGAAPAPVPIPSLLPNASLRSIPSRNSLGGTMSSMASTAAGGGGTGGGSGGTPLSKSLPNAGSPPAASTNTSIGAIAAASNSAGSRLLRPPPVPPTPGMPIGVPLPVAAPPSPGSPSPSTSSPIPVLLSIASPRTGGLIVLESGQASSLPSPLATQAALQLQLVTAAAAAVALPPYQQQQHQQHSSARPSSARSVAGGGMVSDGLNGSLSSRRLSMTGVFEASLTAPSQKLVLAAAHELQHVQMLHLNSTNNNHTQNGHQSQQQSQPTPPLQQSQLLQLLPPSQLPLQQQSRPVVNSARGPSVTGAGTSIGKGSGNGGNGGGTVTASAAVPPTPARETRSSDPGMCSPMPTVAATSEFGFPMPELSPAGRPSLAPLPSTSLQAVRAGTPAAAAAAAAALPQYAGVGWPLGPTATSSLQLQLRAPRPEPLPQRPEPPPPPLSPPSAVSVLPEPVLQRPESLPPLPATGSSMSLGAVGTASLKGAAVPLGRAGTLAPLTVLDEPLTVATGPVAESTQDSRTPDLDPAALVTSGCRLGSGSGSRGEPMELTVRFIPTKSASPGAALPVDKFAVQSSVRQKLQIDPLQFHPPAAAAGGIVRRHSGGAQYLDPLEATPRLILGSGATTPTMGPSLRTGRSDSPRLVAAAAMDGGAALWAPSQDILPHMFSRGNSSSSSSNININSGSRLCFSPTTLTAASGTVPSIVSPCLEFPKSTPRPRNNTGTVDGATVGGAPVVHDGRATAQLDMHLLQGPTPRTHHQQQQQEQRALRGVQSNYLQALAAAAGLGHGLASGAGLRRQRSISDSGCGSFLAGADSGPVGLPLEGGLAVLGDMWARVQAERNHNTRYNVADTGPPTTGNLSHALDDAMVLGSTEAATYMSGNIRLDASISSLPLKMLRAATPRGGGAAAAATTAAASTTAAAAANACNGKRG